MTPKADITSGIHSQRGFWLRYFLEPTDTLKKQTKKKCHAEMTFRKSS
jgi:hypothetical protein